MANQYDRGCTRPATVRPGPPIGGRFRPGDVGEEEVHRVDVLPFEQGEGDKHPLFPATLAREDPYANQHQQDQHDQGPPLERRPRPQPDAKLLDPAPQPGQGALAAG